MDDASFLVSEAKKNLSAISFNVVAPNNDIEGVFNFNFKEVDKLSISKCNLFDFLGLTLTTTATFVVHCVYWCGV